MSDVFLLSKFHSNVKTLESLLEYSYSQKSVVLEDLYIWLFILLDFHLFFAPVSGNERFVSHPHNKQFVSFYHNICG